MSGLVSVYIEIQRKTKEKRLFVGKQTKNDRKSCHQWTILPEKTKNKQFISHMT
jgi:hypothetical protein